ncbi:MAG: M1 family metallopeptidase [Ignavibacteriales bacterium]|nr:MAG: M1 family metallopeptidase [Ignavibacteriaceae bacterium]MBW7872215.1 M1 family metallopeptidase [Ignavibacteria bacterium]MCZ2144028.1 M1 family metallopeptidase [Ignavibacteriales bacterium]OQY70457.1 MAG: hypothetical protein B6D45_11145 [Ignavibacteriales bacterium UTCHB3]MBV6445639.1 hypothetical protein [Ignavibacteriaceae bacterium]
MKYENLKLMTIFSLSTVAALLFGWYSLATNPNFQDYKGDQWNGYKELPASDSLFENGYDVLHYDIGIDLFFKEKKIEGEVSIKFVPLKQLNSLTLNFSDKMSVEKVISENGEEKFNHKSNLLTVDKTLEKGDTTSITIKYSGNPSKNKNFFFSKINGVEVVYTLNEPENARDWIPCNDRPYDKATTNISITADSLFTSVSIGKLDSVTTKSETGKKTYYWHTAYPVATYLISFMSSRYVVGTSEYVSSLNGSKLPLYIYGFPWQSGKYKEILDDHKEMIGIFENYFGEYPFAGEKYAVAAFLWEFGAMEYPTVSGFGSGFIDSYPAQKNVFVHELAHHWFGDAVTLSDWKDIWLNEGFATFCEWLYFEELGKRNGKDYLTNIFDYAKLPEMLEGKIYDPQDLFGSNVYIKGAWVLRMLRKEMGDEQFFKGLRAYFQKFKFRNSSTSDFVTVMTQFHGNDLTTFFDQWVYSGRGVVMLSVSKPVVKKNGSKYSVEVEIIQKQQEKRIYDFLLDIEFKEGGKEGKSKTETKRVKNKKEKLSFELDFYPKELKLDPNNFLLFWQLDD